MFSYLILNIGNQKWSETQQISAWKQKTTKKPHMIVYQMHHNSKLTSQKDRKKKNLVGSLMKVSASYKAMIKS